MLKGVLANQLLAILFATPEVVTEEELSQVFSHLDADSLKSELTKLIETFNGMQDAVEIRRVAGGFRMTTRVEHHEVIRDYLKSKPSARLSQAALETLAVVAYKQPVTVPEIMEIRGVKGSSTIKTLLEKRLIEIRGRRKVVGRPILYGTSQHFLIAFGLDELSELPSLEEFEELIGEMQADDESESSDKQG